MIGKTISHYKILEELGRGGMGVVYKAEDTKLKRTVALKFLPPELTRDPEAKARFIQEAQAASALQHHNICTIHDIDETTDGQLFIVMDYYQGETLKDKLKDIPLTPPSKGDKGGCKSFSVEESIDITIQIAEGLEKAHEKGIVHRDIKPANIFITNDGLVKILDFGLAKLAGHTSRTKVETTLGTVAYMSPEQAQGKEIDQRTDIWSLGVVLYEMVTGKKPFQSEYEQALIYAILNEEPPAVSSLRPDIPPQLEQIIQRALQKDQDKRFQNVEELLEMLGKLHQKPAEQPKMKVKWNKRIAIFASVIILLAVIGLYLFYPRSGPPTTNQKSIAVLPFKNLSDSKEDEYFSDGITEDILTQLSKISDLNVISRTTIMQYKNSPKSLKQIGEELKVGVVLEGSVRRAGDRIRISSQLIDASADRHLWADTYDREMKDVFAVQSEVAEQIAIALKAKMEPEEKKRIEKKQTENTEAYQLYLKGRFHWNKRRLDDIKIATNYFEQAIEKDPGYALAYAGLASACVLPPQYGIPARELDMWYTRAREAANKALQIDSTLAEAHTVLGEIAQDHYFDWDRAEKHFRRAIELDPGYPTAHHWYTGTLLCLSRFEEALAGIKRAQELDPLSLIISVTFGDILYFMRQYDKAIAQYKNTLSLDPNFPWAHLGLSSVFQMQGRFDEAIAEYQTIENLIGKNPVILSYLGRTYAMAGRKQEAVKVLDELLHFSQQGTAVSTGIAYIYYQLGDKDKTFEWLEKAYQVREVELPYFAIDPFWDDLHSDPRFITLVKKLGLGK